MAETYSGQLRKMKAAWNGSEVQYMLHWHNRVTLSLNEWVGKQLRLSWSGAIYCVACAKAIKKTYGDGFCFDCFSKSPEAAPCIVRPELCEAHLGKGRDAAWEEAHHNQPHVVYLAQTHGIKVGVTRETNVPGRWMDQGAWRAIPLARVPYRMLAGLIEVELKQYLSDKTDWRKMLTHETGAEDLARVAAQMGAFLPPHLSTWLLSDAQVTELRYPVLAYPTRVATAKLEETPQIHFTLEGIRGQYLYLGEERVINVRKYTGYEVELALL
jgi:hypothetical protein